MSDRAMPHKVKDGTVKCHSGRNGADPLMIVLHDTEGANIDHSARDLLGLYGFFDKLSTQASSTVATDNDGQSIRMMPDAAKPWSNMFYNPWTLSIEMVHRNGESYTDAIYDETARWVALWSRRHGIPIRRGSVSKDGRILKSGVFTHKQLGHLGGDHQDPIPPFDVNRLLRRARHFRKLQEAHA